ncbi:MAG TPA: CCA tRNA nucleotidyltransferase, partial [Actinomycetes bacterium]|nr:CCA tRNA nucleotidyltransferase [Actinomycetes bacterium]
MPDDSSPPSEPARDRAARAAALAQARRRLAAELVRVAPVAAELGSVFAAAGHSLALVGGPVRDMLLGRPSPDLDFTTDARPDDVARLLKGWGDAWWETGIAYGTVGARKDDLQVEVTTYRAEVYRSDSRKPEVTFGDTLEDDLVRRDLTVNAMAVTLPDATFVDPFGGLEDLADEVLRTPGRP